MKLVQTTSVKPLLALGLVLIALTHQAATKSSSESQPEVQSNPDSVTKAAKATKESERAARDAERLAKENERAAKEAEKAAREAERAATKEEKQAAKAAKKAAKSEEESAQKVAETEAEKEANKAIKAAERADKKAAKQEAREAARAEGRSLVPGNVTNLLDDPQCLEAINQCSLLTVLESEIKPAWKRTTLKNEMKAVYKQRKDELNRLKEYIIKLIDFTIENPNADKLLTELCQDPQNNQGNSDSGNDDFLTPSSTADPWTPSSTADPWTPSSTADPWTPSYTADPWTRTTAPLEPRDKTSATPVDPWTDSTTLAQRCTSGSWNEWSAPYGFGQQERVRIITQPGVVCPEAQTLREERNIITTITEDGDYVIDDVENVSQNFENDFIRASEDKPHDLVLVMDSSGSINDEDFEAMKRGVIILIQSLCGGFGPAPNQHRLSIVQFSTDTLPVHNFADSQDPATLEAVVNNTRPMYGYTCTGDALQQAFNQFDPSKGSRDFAVRDTLLITDGQSNCGADILASSQILQLRSNVYAMAIGLASDEYARGEISSLVSNGNKKHLFSSANFQDFQAMVQKVKNRKDARQCQEIVIN